MLPWDNCEVVPGLSRAVGELIRGTRESLPARVGPLASREETIVVRETFLCATRLEVDRRMMELASPEVKCAVPTILLLAVDRKLAVADCKLLVEFVRCVAL